MSISQWDRADRRERPRARLHLRLAIVYPKRDGVPVRPVYHGSTHDICMSGLSLLAEENVFHEGAVNVLLSLPPVHNWAAQKIITARALMSYAIHSSKLNAFKVGLRFQEFKEDGKALLQTALRDASRDSEDSGLLLADDRIGAPSDSRRRGE